MNAAPTHTASLRTRAPAPSWSLLAIASLLFAASGASCPQSFTPLAPVERVLPESATAVAVLTVINRNTELVRDLSATQATVSSPGAPSLRANLALRRPLELRLRADTALTGPELDLGSNPELFWLWVRRSPQSSVLYCRHADYATSAARQVLPIEPQWLVDAIGLPTYDLAGQHEGPTLLRRGQWEIRSRGLGPTGDVTKVTVVDSSRGWLLEQHLYDARGERIASAILSRHERDPASGAVLPRTVQIDWPAMQLSVELRLNGLRINQLVDNSGELFALPQYPGYDLVDLADPNLQWNAPPGGASEPLGAAPMGGGSPPPSSAALPPGTRWGQPPRRPGLGWR